MSPFSRGQAAGSSEAATALSNAGNLYGLQACLLCARPLLLPPPSPPPLPRPTQPQEGRHVSFMLTPTPDASASASMKYEIEKVLILMLCNSCNSTPD